MTFMTAVSYDLIAFFDEAPIIVELYMHSLFDNLTDRDQVFGDSGDMQYVVAKIRQRYVNLRRDPGASDQRISDSCD